MASTTATLALEDGTLLRGAAFGAATDTVFELVFNTSMTGYQEILTDPSYYGQGVLFTVSHIGNVGINTQDYESHKPQVSAVVIRSLSPVVSSWRAEQPLSDWLAERGVPGISEVDTRYLTRKLREGGTLRAALSTQGTPAETLLERARTWPGLDGVDSVRGVTCAQPYEWTDDAAMSWVRPHPTPHRGRVFAGEQPSPSPCPLPLPNLGEGGGWGAGEGQAQAAIPEKPTPESPTPFHKGGDWAHVVVYDFGVKFNILRHLVAQGARVTVLPATASAEQALSLAPHGIVLSNGPGDPLGLPYAVETTRKLLKSGVPMLGICLGHQLMGLALGGRRQKLKFGHHGGNHPVKDLRGGQAWITAQNHNYVVDSDTLPGNVEITHVSLNDGSLEGMALRDRPAFSIQFHPEASPGPHDAHGVFAAFFKLIADCRL